MEQFYGERTPLPGGVVRQAAQARQRPGAREALTAIAESFLEGEEQGTLPVPEIAALGIPTAVIWGTQDRITPTRQAHKLAGTIATHVFDRVGHSIVDEVPEEVFQILSQNMR